MKATTFCPIDVVWGYTCMYDFWLRQWRETAAGNVQMSDSVLI